MPVTVGVEKKLKGLCTAIHSHRSGYILPAPAITILLSIEIFQWAGYIWHGSNDRWSRRLGFSV